MLYIDLYPKICSFENLFLAFHKARKGKRGKESTSSFEYDLEKELLCLQAELETGIWQPGAYHSFYIHDPKRRLISAAPIGNLTSQFWANVYLNSFDHFVKREVRCPAYVRYVDDFLLFSNDLRQLQEWKTKIQARLACLRLTLHEPQTYPVNNGIPFLGFCIYPEHRRLKKRRGIAFQRRFRRAYKQWLAGKIPAQRLEESARSWKAHAGWGDTHGLQKSVLDGFNNV
jgi:hypothetical protein